MSLGRGSPSVNAEGQGGDAERAVGCVAVVVVTGVEEEDEEDGGWRGIADK